MANDVATLAAGGIVWRKRLTSSARAESGRIPIEILLIHRPSYDDWTFPKGKLDPDESLPAAAVREIAEETGLRVRLGVPIQDVTYRTGAGRKVVSYWSARQVGPDAEPFKPNKEVDEIRWVRVRTAKELLSYDHDLALLETFRELRDVNAHRTRTLVVMRHGKAMSRDEFTGSDDLERPLESAGKKRAKEVIPVLHAYGVQRVVSSPAVRCTKTVEPFAHSMSTFLEIDDRLAEGGRRRDVQRSIDSILDHKKPVVISTHRPTLPAIFDALDIATIDLKPGAGVIVHHRKGSVLATEALA